MPHAFGCAKGAAPPLWMLLAIGIVELSVSHLLLSHWWPRVALGIGVVTGASLLWLAYAIVSLGRRPTVVGFDALVMRAGRFKSISIDVRNVASARATDPADPVKGPPVLNLALLAYPNVTVRLHTPVRWRRREIALVVHRLDEPAAFISAVDAAAIASAT